MHEFVLLTTSHDPIQKALIGETLRGAAIPFVPTPIGAHTMPQSAAEVLFHVPGERLQEARDLLCAKGVVCEISERLLKRSLEEIVKPLLGKTEHDLTRLTRFLETNNKETVRALFEATRKWIPK